MLALRCMPVTLVMEFAQFLGYTSFISPWCMREGCSNYSVCVSVSMCLSLH